jgi:hypothetical protein
LEILTCAEGRSRCLPQGRTTDHDEVRNWAEGGGGGRNHFATEKGERRAGLMRIDYDEPPMMKSLGRIGCDEFFRGLPLKKSFGLPLRSGKVLSARR